jgi:hypothetical protein
MLPAANFSVFFIQNICIIMPDQSGFYVKDKNAGKTARVMQSKNRQGMLSIFALAWFVL